MNESYQVVRMRAEAELARRYHQEGVRSRGLDLLRSFGVKAEHVTTDVDTYDLPRNGDPRDPEHNVSMVFHVDFGIGENLHLRMYDGYEHLTWEGTDVAGPADLLAAANELISEQKEARSS